MCYGRYWCWRGGHLATRLVVFCRVFFRRFSGDNKLIVITIQVYALCKEVCPISVTKDIPPYRSASRSVIEMVVVKRKEKTRRTAYHSRQVMSCLFFVLIWKLTRTNTSMRGFNSYCDLNHQVLDIICSINDLEKTNYAHSSGCLPQSVIISSFILFLFGGL